MVTKSDILLEKLLNIEEKVDKISKTLHGNGRPGMIEEFSQFKGAVKVAGFLLTLLASAGVISSFFI